MPLRLLPVRSTAWSADAGRDDQAYLVEPYQTGAGVGLGLAICQQIVDSHPGTLRLTRVPRAGTTVTITLPWAEATGPG